MQNINIDFYRDENPILNDAYDRLISKIPLLKKVHGYNSFTITGCHPGVGTTTIAVSIAVSLANSGWKTLLVDSDIRKSPEKKRLSEGVKYGFSDVLDESVPLNEALCTTNINKLHYLACGTKSDVPIILLNSENFNKFIKHADDYYDYLIFDSPALNTTIDAAIIASKTSGAILVAGYMQTKKGKIEIALRELEHTGANMIGIVLNSVAKRDYKRYIENYDYFVSKNRRRKQASK